MPWPMTKAEQTMKSFACQPLWNGLEPPSLYGKGPRWPAHNATAIPMTLSHTRHFIRSWPYSIIQPPKTFTTNTQNYSPINHIGSQSCLESVFHYVYISVLPLSLKKKIFY